MSNAADIVIIEISSSSSSDEEDQDQEEEDDVPLIQLLRSKIRKKNTAMKDENRKKIKRNSKDSDDECMILEHNPFESIDNDDDDDDDHKDKQQLQEEIEEEDISILSEKGQVACRDFPHSRHLCVKFPFDTTPHQSYCGQGVALRNDYCYPFGEPDVDDAGLYYAHGILFYSDESNYCPAASRMFNLASTCYCYVCDSAAPCEFWHNASGGHCHAVEKGPGWDAMRKAARPTPTHC